MKILEEVEAEREKLKELKKTMKKDVKDSKKAYFKEIRANEPPRGDARKEYWKKARKDWAAKEKAMYSKYNEQALGSSPKGDGDSVGSTASGNTAADGLGPPESTEGNVSVIPNYQQNLNTVADRGPASSVQPLDSSNSNNKMYVLDAQANFNTFA